MRCSFIPPCATSTNTKGYAGKCCKSSVKWASRTNRFSPPWIRCASFFLASAFEQFAYQNTAFQIGAGQTISKPHTVARQTELLQLEPGAKVLEIGTGSGYQCAVLCAMGYKVYSIERQRLLFDKAGPLLKSMGFKPELFYGDGYKGKAVFGPYDGIIVTCGAPEIPEALLLQLAVGGRLVIPVGEGDTQRMFTFERTGEKEFSRQEHGEFAFVPMLASRAQDA